MRTEIHPSLAELPLVQEADAILRKCVHCGFCTATCPTYQLLGDELDGPRGRIYLIKDLLETDSFNSQSRQHLDRCLTCRSCETTCPSGVEYGRLLDIGRVISNEKVKPQFAQRIAGFLLRTFVPTGSLFSFLLRVGRLVRPLLPRGLARHVPRKIRAEKAERNPGARILLLSGCVQSAATPSVTAALQLILKARGVTTDAVSEGCCGALDYHLGAHDKGLTRMRQVIDLIYPRLEEVDHVVSSATGCGVTLKEYPLALSHDAAYRDRARAVAEKVVDASELFEELPVTLAGKVAVHTPCSMQHGMKLTGRVEQLLASAGAEIVSQKDGHLCCGSAGSYSMLQPELAERLRDNKLASLQANKPEVIVTANIGCQLHLDADADVPVMHWLEYVADRLSQ